jgi:ubiquitin carboxyl-terminal hydrolase 5/13
VLSGGECAVHSLTFHSVIASGLAHCSSCDLNNNLWLCLTCGNLNCGRQQFGGLSGNGHAVAHYSSTQHPVAVKLGTIQPDGTADIYCYACDDEKLDPNLAQHLGHFGIQVEAQIKTEKSLGELQVEQNMKFDFAMSGEDGKQLEPLFGPGLTGLRNLGNRCALQRALASMAQAQANYPFACLRSCYMASVLQALFALPAFSDRYYTKGSAHSLLCPNPNPATCFECQMAKIADGLLSGRYSHPNKTTSDSNDDETAKAFVSEGSGQTEKDVGRPVQAETSAAFQEGIRPIMFKTLVGKDHPEFSTMRQQDSEEFFKYLVSMIQKSNAAQAVVPGTTLDNEASGDPTDIFKFQMQERLQCTECKGVRYKTVSEESVSMNVPFIKAMPSSSDASNSDAMDVDAKGKTSTEGPNATRQEPSTSSGKTDYQPVALEECLRLLTNPTNIEYKCPQCNKSVEAEKSTKFATFPETLVIQAKKFTLVNWVPQKVGKAYFPSCVGGSNHSVPLRSCQTYRLLFQTDHSALTSTLDMVN